MVSNQCATTALYGILKRFQTLDETFHYYNGCNLTKKTRSRGIVIFEYTQLLLEGLKYFGHIYLFLFYPDMYPELITYRTHTAQKL